MRLAFALFAVLFCCGCGQQLPSVRGSITMDEQPVPTGYITLMPTGGGPTVGSPIKGGTYQIGKLETGPYRAIIVGFQQAQFPESSAELEAAASQGKSSQEFPDLTQNAEGNNVEVEIEDGNQVLDFALKSRR